MKKKIALLLIAALLAGVVAVALPGEMAVPVGASPLWQAHFVFNAPPGTQPKGLTWDGTNLWMTSYMQNPGLYKLDPHTGHVLAKFNPPTASNNGYGGLTWDGSSLWQADGYGGGIYRLNPSNANVLQTIPSPTQYPSDLAFDGHHLWVAGYPENTLYKLNPVNGQVVVTFASLPPGQAQLFGMTFGGGFLWLSINNVLYKMDPNTGTIVDSRSLGVNRPDGLAWAQGKCALLICSFDEAKVYGVPFRLPF